MTSPSMLVARREVIQRVRRRSFYVFTGLLVAVIIAGGVIAALVGGGSSTKYAVGVVMSGTSGDAASEFAAILTVVGNSGDVTITTLTFDDTAQASTALGAGDVDVVVDIGARAETWQTGVDVPLESLVDTGWRAWSDAPVEYGVRAQAMKNAGTARTDASSSTRARRKAELAHRG